MTIAATDLDITDETCPMTFVRTKLHLERMADGEVVRVLLRDGEPRENVPRAVTDHGHELLGIDAMPGGLFQITIRKRGGTGR